MREISPYGGIDEFDDGDLGYATRHREAKLLALVADALDALEAEAGSSVTVGRVSSDNRVELHVDHELRWVGQISVHGRLLLSEQSDRVSRHL